MATRPKPRTRGVPVTPAPVAPVEQEEHHPLARELEHLADAVCLLALPLSEGGVDQEIAFGALDHVERALRSLSDRVDALPRPAERA